MCQEFPFLKLASARIISPHFRYSLDFILPKSRARLRAGISAIKRKFSNDLSGCTTGFAACRGEQTRRFAVQVNRLKSLFYKESLFYAAAAAGSAWASL